MPEYAIMDKVMIEIGDRVVKSTVMYSDETVFDYNKGIEHKKGFYVNPMFGGNIYLEYDECTVTILGKWEYPKGYVCPKCGYILKHNEWDHVCL